MNSPSLITEYFKACSYLLKLGVADTLHLVRI